MGVIRFPFELTVGQLSNDPHQEFIFEVLEGRSAARQKRIIMLARDPRLGLLSDENATLLIDCLGLGSA